ncbi:tetratricopeptide repeat protein [Streptomyces sp. NPDC058385]|uniref:tetratricopeptide repeat protein n=1 Tax=Streptomyces sp. NPDC058385 TaxID=3346473 RepID=UPI00364D2E1B
MIHLDNTRVMEERRALVIASHWDALESKPEDRLELLDPCAQELHELLLDPARGACVPAFGDGLLTDPVKVNEVDHAVAEAFEEASAEGACLVLAFMGHGHTLREGRFLYPVRSSPKEPGPETAFDLPARLSELARVHGGVPELTVVLDACLSGEALLAAAEHWLRPAMNTGRRIELVTSSDLRVSYALQFSEALNRLVRQGDVRLDPVLRTASLRGAVGARLARQVPQSVSFDGGGAGLADLYGPWLAHNVAYNRNLSPLAGSSDRDVLLPALRHFQPPAELARFVRAVRDHRLVAITGDMGTGKTTLATALCRPELLPCGEADSLPTVAAVVRLSDSHWVSGTSVKQLVKQLQTHLPRFSEAREKYREQVSQAQRVLLPTLDAELAGPLALMERQEPVRVIVDGLDQVNPANRPELVKALVGLQDTAPDWFGVVATVREGIPLHGDWHREPVPAPDERQLQDYLQSHHVSKTGRNPIIDRTGGNWQLTKVLADHRGAPVHSGPMSFTDVYLEVLGPLRQLAPGGQGEWLDAVMVVVAASGPAVTLPRALLAQAVSKLGGPHDDEGLEQILELVPGLVVRSSHQAETELFGVHHPSLIEYVADDQDLIDGHRALVETLTIMAPMDQHNPDDPLHTYAEEAEAEHLWQAAERETSLYDRLLDSLERRAASEAAVNRDRWAAWAERLTQRPGHDSAQAMHARGRAAYWTGKAGAYERSRELYRNLLEDQRRVFTDSDPRLLESRNRIAYATGEVGDFTEAVELHRAVLEDQERVLGADDPRTLKTRHHIAYWTGRDGNMADVLNLHQDLLEDQLRVLGPTDQAVLESRHYIAYWHGMLGSYDTALALHDELLRDRIALFGEDHPQVIFSRMNICKFLGESGRRHEALDAYQELLPDVQRIRGELHPNTLLVRLNIARYTGELGDLEGGLELHEQLIVDQRETLGPSHPTVMISRYNIAMLKAELGDPACALAELEELLQDRIARYGGQLHPEVIRTRFGIARVIAMTGDVTEAVDRLRGVKDDRSRILGEEHPDTLATQAELENLLAQ